MPHVDDNICLLTYSTYRLDVWLTIVRTQVLLTGYEEMYVRRRLCRLEPVLEAFPTLRASVIPSSR